LKAGYYSFSSAKGGGSGIPKDAMKLEINKNDVNGTN